MTLSNDIGSNESYNNKQNYMKVLVISDSILSNINSFILSKSEKHVSLNEKSDCLIVNTGNNDLINKMTLSDNVMKTYNESKQVLPETRTVFSNIIYFNISIRYRHYGPAEKILQA